MAVQAINNDGTGIFFIKPCSIMIEPWQRDDKDMVIMDTLIPSSIIARDIVDYDDGLRRLERLNQSYHAFSTMED